MGGGADKGRVGVEGGDKEMIQCTRCQGTGFLNIEQVPEEYQGKGYEIIDKWLIDRNKLLAKLGGCSCFSHPPCSFCVESHDVVRCDCCGDGEEDWYGVPGEHYNSNDPRGAEGPYSYNGGLCECS